MDVCVEIQKKATTGDRCKISSHIFICEGAMTMKSAVTGAVA